MKVMTTLLMTACGGNCSFIDGHAGSGELKIVYKWISCIHLWE